MSRVAFTLFALVFTVDSASAQSPAIGQLPLPGDLYGYSPLVPTIDPFPSRSSGYYHSMFHPQYGGKRIPVGVTRLPAPGVVVEGPVPPIPLAEPAALPVGPTVTAAPQPISTPRGFRRFGR
ncbi:MAG: hypothetical protein U0792_20290 [Gemmataceae bacterium]